LGGGLGKIWGPVPPGPNIEPLLVRMVFQHRIETVHFAFLIFVRQFLCSHCLAFSVTLRACSSSFTYVKFVITLWGLIECFCDRFCYVHLCFICSSFASCEVVAVGSTRRDYLLTFLLEWYFDRVPYVTYSSNVDCCVLICNCNFRAVLSE